MVLKQKGATVEAAGYVVKYIAEAMPGNIAATYIIDKLTNMSFWPAIAGGVAAGLASYFGIEHARHLLRDRKINKEMKQASELMSALPGVRAS